jgi:hypothetical protein
MYARVTRMNGSADQIEQAVRSIEDSTSTIQQLAGLQRALLLVDRQAGEAMTITVWDTQAHMEEARATARQILGGLATSAGVTLSEPKLYEVASETTP